MCSKLDSSISVSTLNTPWSLIFHTSIDKKQHLVFAPKTNGQSVQLPHGANWTVKPIFVHYKLGSLILNSLHRMYVIAWLVNKDGIGIIQLGHNQRGNKCFFGR